MRISAQVNTPSVLRNVKKFEPAVKKSAAKWALNTMREMQSYPPPHSKYKRTGKLGSNWRAEKTETGARVYNDTEYATYVEGPRQVGWAAEAGWPQLSDVSAKNRATFRADIQQAVDEALS